MYKIKGIIKVINNEVQITDSFKKKEFVIEENSSQYPQYINFQLTQERCLLLNDYKVGDLIEVDFNLRGREWTDNNGANKYFNSLDVWRISSGNQSYNSLEIPPAKDIVFANNEDDEDTLPF